MPSEPQQWINVRDFTPGIRHRIGAPGSVPIGAADGAQTYDCVALVGGGLGPLPKLTATKTRNHSGVVTPEDGSLRISGFHVAGPMQAARYTSDYTGDDNIEMHFAFEGVSSGSVHKWFWERVRHWAGTTQDTIRDFTVTHDGSWVKADQNYRPTAFIDHRLHATDPAEMGDLFVVAGWSPDDMEATANIWLIFPDPDAPTTLSYHEIWDDNEVSAMVSHQGRIVSLDRHVFQHGNAGYWITNDQFVWTQVNLPIVLPKLTGTLVASVASFTHGPISGYGAMGSISAQELLVIKHRGGAVTISGDIDEPTVYNNPGVVGSNGALTYGVNSPVGFIYGVKNGGVYAFGGGDTSVKLSQFLDDDFWQIKPSDWTDFYGKFEIFRNWILTPNNYIFDTDTQSWWRIDPTHPVFQWSASPQNSKFYGAPVSFESGGAIAYTYDFDTKVQSYRWQSQYLAPSIDRKINVREITVRGKATGAANTITVTLIDEAGNTQSKALTLANTDIPKLHRVNFAFQGQGIKVRIDAAGGGSDEAPVVLEVNIGYDEINRIGRS